MNNDVRKCRKCSSGSINIPVLSIHQRQQELMFRKNKENGHILWCIPPPSLALPVAVFRMSLPGPPAIQTNTCSAGIYLLPLSSCECPQVPGAASSICPLLCSYFDLALQLCSYFYYSPSLQTEHLFFFFSLLKTTSSPCSF